MGKVSLEGLEFFAHHGVYKEENKIGNKYNVDITVSTNLQKAILEDNIHHTLNYQILYQIVSEEMAISSKLLEYVGGRIMRRVFATFAEAEHIEINVCKFNPPIDGICKWAKINLSQSRNEI